MKILFTIFLLIFYGCGQCDFKNNEITIELPDNKADGIKFANSIKSFEVINLQVDSNYMYIEEADLRVSENYYFFLSKGMQLTCYDKTTGELQFSRNIKGRGRNECVYANSSFIIGDNIIINDVGKLKSYDHTGKFCGMIGELESDYVLPFENGYISCCFYGSGYDRDRCLTILDDEFNVKNSYFKIPKEYKPFCYSRIEQTSPDRYIYNDTLRFICQYTYRLHSFPGFKTYHFVTSNPIPKNEISNLGSELDPDFIERIYLNGYENVFYDLVENQDYIMFKYGLGMDTYCVLLSKYNNKVYSIGSDNEYSDVRIDVWKTLILWSHFLYSDGKYFYARAYEKAFEVLEMYKDVLDTKQLAIYETMRKCLESSDERDFVFYYKIEI